MTEQENFIPLTHLQKKLAGILAFNRPGDIADFEAKYIIRELTGVSPEVPRGMLETYDVVLVEADGSHGFPLKCPASFEPVIPVETDLVIGVAGASAVGKSFREKCHRFETACQSLGRLPEDLITEQDVIRCLTEKFGQKKNVDCEYRYVVNQAEVLSKKQMERLLYFQKSQTDIGVVISFSMERWYNS